MNSEINFKITSKRNLRKTIIFIGGILLVFSFLVPFFIWAQSNTSTGAQTARQALCNVINQLSPKIEARITDRNEIITQKKNQIEQRLEERWQLQDIKLAEKRLKWDKNRTEHFTKLEQGAQTDNQKQAVFAFEQAVTLAVVARREAIDEAIDNFRQGMEASKAFRQAGIDAAKNTFRNSVRTAYQGIQTDCANNLVAATIRLNLMNNLQTARTKYQSDLQALEKWRTTVEQLIAARKAAIEKAIDDFKAALKEAQDNFKEAMAEEVAVDEQCVAAGGTVGTSLCCTSVNDFPNLCLIGACGCSAENSKEVKICDCGEGKCFNGVTCVSISE